MQITLNEVEIKKAILAFVGAQGISITGKNVDISLTAGRGPNGMSATIDISNDDVSVSSVKSLGAQAVEPVPEINTSPVVKEGAGLTFNQALPRTDESDSPFDETAAEAKPLFGKS